MRKKRCFSMVKYRFNTKCVLYHFRVNSVYNQNQLVTWIFLWMKSNASFSVHSTFYRDKCCATPIEKEKKPELIFLRIFTTFYLVIICSGYCILYINKVISFGTSFKKLSLSFFFIFSLLTIQMNVNRMNGIVWITR